LGVRTPDPQVVAPVLRTGISDLLAYICDLCDMLRLTVRKANVGDARTRSLRQIDDFVGSI